MPVKKQTKNIDTAIQRQDQVLYHQFSDFKNNQKPSVYMACSKRQNVSFVVDDR